MRLFIAIELPKTVRSKIAGVMRELKLLSNAGRFVPEENMHITLHFIGESNDLNGAVEAMKSACEGIRPFVLKPGRYDYFVKGDRKTSFIGVEGDLKELNILHESLEAALADNGFSREYKRYSPHITLGRNVEHDELVGAELRKIEIDSEMTVSGITLFESTREKGKVIYTALHREKF